MRTARVVHDDSSNDGVSIVHYDHALFQLAYPLLLSSCPPAPLTFLPPSPVSHTLGTYLPSSATSPCKPPAGSSTHPRR